jgi:5,10-methylenetetrahydromethanopterin reductase
MRVAMGVGGEVVGAPVRPQDIVDDVVRAEADGFGSAWSVHFSRGVDALGVLAMAGARTSRIGLGVGIVPTYPRHPLALAQEAATAQAFCGGRLTLGVGVSHRAGDAERYRSSTLTDILVGGLGGGDDDSRAGPG